MRQHKNYKKHNIDGWSDPLSYGGPCNKCADIVTSFGVGLLTSVRARKPQSVLVHPCPPARRNYFCATSPPDLLA